MRFYDVKCLIVFVKFLDDCDWVCKVRSIRVVVGVLRFVMIEKIEGICGFD